jgi:hypothetical protein
VPRRFRLHDLEVLLVAPVRSPRPAASNVCEIVLYRYMETESTEFSKELVLVQVRDQTDCDDSITAQHGVSAGFVGICHRLPRPAQSFESSPASRSGSISGILLDGTGTDGDNSSANSVSCLVISWVDPAHREKSTVYRSAWRYLADLSRRLPPPLTSSHYRGQQDVHHNDQDED